DPTRRYPDIGAFWGALKHAIQQDEELSKHRTPQPPPALTSPLGPKTKRGTLILHPEAGPFAESTTSSSIFAESSTNSRNIFPESPTASGPRGTLHMPVHQGGSQPPVNSHPITIRPPGAELPADPLGPTHCGQPRKGASPLSFTVQPGQDLLTLEQRTLIEQQPYPLSSPPPSPTSHPPSALSSIPPMETQGASPSLPRWLLVFLGLGGLGALLASGWFLSHMLTR
ncbi:MAG: hypothetical protein RMJ98_15350, partial [Myxococcales bacterium]|nr:hypothetical protein [Polyangiaceae bacterium]MDW8250670.1 hypothetical protein [Myxococcales bacterium]